MDEATARGWDIFIKAVAVLGVAVGGFWTYYKFRDDHRVDQDHQHQVTLREEEIRRRELNSFIFQRQAQLYFDIARISAAIAYPNDNDPKKLHENELRFHELVNGELAVVMDRRVELAVDAFHHCFETSDLSNPNKPCQRSATNQYGNPLSQKGLPNPYPQRLAQELSACIRSALQQDRHIQLGEGAEWSIGCPYD